MNSLAVGVTNQVVTNIVSYQRDISDGQFTLRATDDVNSNTLLTHLTASLRMRERLIAAINDKGMSRLDPNSQWIPDFVENLFASTGYIPGLSLYVYGSVLDELEGRVPEEALNLEAQRIEEFLVSLKMENKPTSDISTLDARYTNIFGTAARFSTNFVWFMTQGADMWNHKQLDINAPTNFFKNKKVIEDIWKDESLIKNSYESAMVGARIYQLVEDFLNIVSHKIVPLWPDNTRHRFFDIHKVIDAADGLLDNLFGDVMIKNIRDALNSVDEALRDEVTSQLVQKVRADFLSLVSQIFTDLNDVEKMEDVSRHVTYNGSTFGSRNDGSGSLLDTYAGSLAKYMFNGFLLGHGISSISSDRTASITLPVFRSHAQRLKHILEKATDTNCLFTVTAANLDLEKIVRLYPQVVSRPNFFKVYDVAKKLGSTL